MSIVSALVDLVMAVFSDSTSSSSFSYSLWFVGVLATLTFQYRRHVAARKSHTSSSSKSDGALLFPSIDDKTSIEKQPTVASDSLNLLSVTPSSTNEPGPQPCSTGLTTRLLPFKNEKGEIDWVFSDDIIPGNELDAFKVTSMPIQAKFMKADADNELLPVTSNSSNSDSLSGKKSELSVLQIHTPSSSSSEDHKDDDHEDHDLDDEGNGDAGDQNYQCPHCSSNFKMRGYLTRHLKKHSTQKAYKCPFHNITMMRNDIDGGIKCHPTGGFSRRDTYKTHLKSRHFRYPRGTATKERNTSPGTCGMCGEWFQNAEIWTEIHIEGAECKHLPPGFKGKSRIKNRMKKQMARMMKEQKLQMKANGLCQPQLVDYQSPVFATPNSTITPLFSSSANDFSDSPTQSIISSTGPSTVPSTGPYTGTPMYEHLQGIKSISRPHTADISVCHMDDSAYSDRYQDYDDDYCLDIEQMSYPMASNTMMPPDALGISAKVARPQYSH